MPPDRRRVATDVRADELAVHERLERIPPAERVVLVGQVIVEMSQVRAGLLCRLGHRGDDRCAGALVDDLSGSARTGRDERRTRLGARRVRDAVHGNRRDGRGMDRGRGGRRRSDRHRHVVRVRPKSSRGLDARSRLRRICCRSTAASSKRFTCACRRAQPRRRWRRVRAGVRGRLFVRLTGTELPEIKHVAHTNFCDIGWRVMPSGRAILVSVIDNLLKGASGQAVQNMNVMLGVDERTGLL